VVVVSGRVIEKIAKNKFDIVVVILWSLVVSFVIVKTYWVAYSTKPRLKHEVPIRPEYDLNNFEPLDLFIVSLAGIIAGILLADVKKMFYGYVGAMLIAYIISVALLSYHTWFIKEGFQAGLSSIAFGWEWAIFAAALDAFVLMVPWIVCLCLVGMIMGAFIRAWI